MADKWNHEDKDVTGTSDEELRGVASGEDDEFDDSEDLDEEEDDEEDDDATL
jgi:hypothetical protein